MGKHFPLSPSGASRWLTCPGSIPLSDGMPDQETTYAAEGTVAHDIADWCLSKGVPAEAWSGDTPQDMLPAVQVYLDFVRGLLAEHTVLSWGSEDLIESAEIENFGGTVDFHTRYEDIEMHSMSVLHVVDYKHGVGMPVVVENNPQLLCYLLLAREHYDQEFDEYRATIVQPRVTSEIETVSYTNGDLDEFKQDILNVIGSETLISGDHCRWCKALTECPKLSEEALAAAQIEFADDDPDTRVQTWSDLMAAAPAIKKLLAELPGRMIEEMKKGVKFPGCKAVQSLGNRSWTKDLTEEEIIARLQRAGIGKRVAAPAKLLTPTQLSKLGHGEKIEDLVVREDRGFTCVLESARGKAVDLSSTETDENLDYDFLY